MAYYNYLCKDTANIVADFLVGDKQSWKTQMTKINNDLKEAFEESIADFLCDYYSYNYGTDVFDILTYQNKIYKSNSKLNFLSVLKKQVARKFRFKYEINWNRNFD